jgi:formylglycine-generating enzyme required for sulfatase activity
LTSAVYIEDERGTRRVEVGDFPLSVGGPEADIQLPETHATEAVAHIGRSDAELFLQPSQGGPPVVCNGLTLGTSQWLRDGDVFGFGEARVEVRIRADSIHFRAEKKAVVSPSEAVDFSEPPLRDSPGSVDDVSGTKIKPIQFEPKPIGSATRARRPIRFSMVLFWLSLLLLGGVAWSVFAARSVLVEIEPLPDRVDVEGRLFALKWGGRYLLWPGSYTVSAEKEGFRRLEASLEVTDERTQTFHFSLEEAPGLLSVSTVPGQGAVVTVDGRNVGVTPLDALELTPGEYEVGIQAERYREFSTRVRIEGGGVVTTVNAELVPLWAAVTFNSEPAGAGLSVDGKTVGSTPATVELMEGSHNYELTMAGHKPLRGRVAVVAGKVQELQAAELDLVDGRLILDSNPREANVTVDGTFRGQTPLDLYLSPGEGHEIGVSRLGYASQSFRVELESGENRSESVDLEAKVGVVEIVCDPPDAELYVNGESRGRANRVLRLAATPQQIEIRKQGYESFGTTLTPTPGFPQSIEVILKTTEEAAAKAVPPVITTARGHELHLISTRRFQMGASRREPGRRANETIREVEITRPYYIGTKEVTNRQFREFKKDHKSSWVKGFSLETDHHPAVRVSWQDGAAYCNWLSKQDSLPPAYIYQGGTLVAAAPPTNGYRFPTEAEWAGAARYPDGVNAVKYPWGSSLPMAPRSGNYADVSAQGLVPVILSNYNDSFPVTAPVDSFEPNQLGLYNMGGNVAEWVQDYYTIYPSGASEIDRDPLGPAEGELHVVRGSGWMHGNVTQLRLSYRDYSNKGRPDVGFRIARYAE